MGRWGFGLVLLAGLVACSVLDKHYNRRDLTCSQGLSGCTLQKQMFSLSEDSGLVQVSGLDLQAVLCCREGERCKTCLLISISLTLLREEDRWAETSGQHDDEDEDDEAFVIMRYSSGPNVHQYWRISFRVTPDARENGENIQLTVLEDEGVYLGSIVNVTVGSLNHSLRFPELKEVCPSEDIEDCKTPRVSAVIDWEQAELRLRVEDEGHNESVQFCVKRKKKGYCWLTSPFIPLHTVTPCMCFQAWRDGAPSRLEICPNNTNTSEFRKNVMRNVSLSVTHSHTYDGRPVLSWKLSAPCVLEGEVWPCRRGAGLDRGCREVGGARVHLQKSSRWEENSTTLWTSGAFVDLSSTKHFLHCVMVKVDGETFGPHCQHDLHRGRWSVPVLISLLIFTLVGVGVCLIRNRLKGWISNWEKTHNSGGSRGEVLLLHMCGGDVWSVGLVCRLGERLCDLGFGVSLDVWSQAELSALGPGPWLHSRLQRLQKRGGKAVLVLSDPALDSARACWDAWRRAGEQGSPENGSSSYLTSVFVSALSCVFSSSPHAERFRLVRFDSQDQNQDLQDLPEPLQDLQLYQLPSESQRLLGELCTERPRSVSQRIKQLIWLRRASRSLARSLKSSLEARRPHSESVLTQEEVLEEEKLPLHV